MAQQLALNECGFRGKAAKAHETKRNAFMMRMRMLHNFRTDSFDIATPTVRRAARMVQEDQKWLAKVAAKKGSTGVSAAGPNVRSDRYLQVLTLWRQLREQSIVS